MVETPIPSPPKNLKMANVIGPVANAVPAAERKKSIPIRRK
jgi:hypothetical protein